MIIPIETVVDLIFANRIGPTILLNGKLVCRDSTDELRVAILTYLETLVPKPRLLSECEEGKPFKVEMSEIVVRRDSGAYRWTDDEPLGFAENFTVIKLAEVT